VPSVEDVFLAKNNLECYAENVIYAFFDIAKKHELIFTGSAQRKNWDTYCVTNVYSYEINWINTVIRKSKEEIKEALSTLLKIVPDYFFCHSESSNYEKLPGYYLYFKDPKKLSSIDENMRDKIRQLCNQILLKNDKTEFCSKYQIDLTFCNPITHPNSLYGMSRED
jgi:hypothetical protein